MEDEGYIVTPTDVPSPHIEQGCSCVQIHIVYRQPLACACGGFGWLEVLGVGAAKVAPITARLFGNVHGKGPSNAPVPAGCHTVDSDGPERAPTTGISQYGALLAGTVLSG